MKCKKILLIDDDPYVVLALAVRLRANGYSVVSAVDGNSAMKMKREEKPDLVILDLGLPGEDGFKLLERMKVLNDAGPAPTIVLSARDPVGNRERALSAGAVAFFQKPPNNHVFLSAIRHALGDREAAPVSGGNSAMAQPN